MSSAVTNTLDHNFIVLESRTSHGIEKTDHSTVDEDNTVNMECTVLFSEKSYSCDATPTTLESDESQYQQQQPQSQASPPIDHNYCKSATLQPSDSLFEPPARLMRMRRCFKKPKSIFRTVLMTQWIDSSLFEVSEISIQKRQLILSCLRKRRMAQYGLLNLGQ